jgi:hypothetical protein
MNLENRKEIIWCLKRWKGTEEIRLRTVGSTNKNVKKKRKQKPSMNGRNKYISRGTLIPLLFFKGKINRILIVYI